jgi:hypothetical protein
MKKKISHKYHHSSKYVELEYFGALLLVGLILALLGCLGMYLTSNPLAFVVFVAPSLVILGFLIFTVHCYIRIFRNGNPLPRIFSSLCLALVSEGILVFLGYFIWILLWKSSPYVGP